MLMNVEDEEKEEGGEEKVECPICGEMTSDQLHYGGLACPSCKAFFRRTVAIHRLPFDSDDIQLLTILCMSQFFHTPADRILLHMRDS